MRAASKPTCGARWDEAVIALHVTRRPGATEPDATALPVPAEGLTIGRSDGCAIVLADPLRLVSREHARVTADGEAGRVRCISSSAPLWVNDAQLDPGGERPLAVGDRLRIGGFEIVVESAEAKAPQGSRLDRWFDLDAAPDPLAAESPLPALAASPGAASAAVVSWQADPHVVTTAPAVQPPPPAPDAARVPNASGSPPAAPALPQAPSRRAPAATKPAAAAPVPAEAPAPPRAARRSKDAAPDLQELAAAFARGAGLATEPAPLTPQAMEHLGALLRATAEGLLALLQSRAIAKRHMRAEGTHIAPRQNNPLKFSPDATEALTRLLQRDPSPGFLDPVAAVQDAHHDLLVHQVAMVAGMRAAVFELFSRLGPEAAENALGPAHGLSRLPLVRAAALWQRHRMQHAQLLEHLDDDFESIFGREFLRAYEAQSRADADARPASPEAS